MLTTTMSMLHTHDALKRLVPRPGDTLVTAQSRPILTMLGARPCSLRPCRALRV